MARPLNCQEISLCLFMLLFKLYKLYGTFNLLYDLELVIRLSSNIHSSIFRTSFKTIKIIVHCNLFPSLMKYRDYWLKRLLFFYEREVKCWWKNENCEFEPHKKQKQGVFNSRGFFSIQTWNLANQYDIHMYRF